MFSNKGGSSVDEHTLPDLKEEHSTEDSATGIVHLDNALRGGIPKGSVVLLAGSSGSGKTIFSFQWLFHGIKKGERGLYITLTEPLFKTLKNLECMSYYDRQAIEEQTLKIMDIRDTYGKINFEDPEKIIELIEKEVMQTHAKRLCIDSVTAIAYFLNDITKIRKFIFELGKVLASLGCTTLLTSEVGDSNSYSIYGVEEFISDGIIRMDQIIDQGEYKRVMQLVKMRGKDYVGETYPLKISKDGIRVFPRIQIPLDYESSEERVSTGLVLLDKMIRGGAFKNSTTLIVGSTGTGKSLLGVHFIMQGLRKGENCLYMSFEESQKQIMRNALGFGWGLQEFLDNGQLSLRCTYANKKYLEEHLLEIKSIVEAKKITRCVIDSLSAISDVFLPEEFLSFANRLNGYLKTAGVTSYFTSAAATFIGTSSLTEKSLSTMTDSIIMLRLVEVDGELQKVINVVKLRGSSHDKSLRKYDITNHGVVIGHSLAGYEGVMSGSTRKVSETVEEKLRDEFRNQLGLKGDYYFEEARGHGISKENIFLTIDKAVTDSAITSDQSNKLKLKVSGILHKSDRSMEAFSEFAKE